MDHQCQASKQAKHLPVFCKWCNSIPFLFSGRKKYTSRHLSENLHRLSAQMVKLPLGLSKWCKKKKRQIAKGAWTINEFWKLNVDPDKKRKTTFRKLLVNIHFLIGGSVKQIFYLTYNFFLTTNSFYRLFIANVWMITGNSTSFVTTFFLSFHKSLL